ncbi:MAG: chorismate-binding protein [Bacteroidaceae bacterium]|nr:chorismate-binding protein [Bacteroidaceae bacterium]
MESSKNSEVKPCAWAYYKLPHVASFTQIKQFSSPRCFTLLSELSNAERGFLTAPFDVKKYPIFLIAPDVVEHYDLETIKSTKVFAQEDLICSEPQFEAYKVMFDRCEQQLKGGAIDKIVLSFAIDIETKGVHVFDSVFTDACLAFPKSYVALWHTPETGTWLTITPEILLKKQSDNHWHTVALAGTMRKDQKQTPSAWSTKNIEEQKYVADYIYNQLAQLNIQPQVGLIQTIEAANLLHLCTDFYFESDLPIGQLLAQLHPTPAVCGMPQKQALAQILAIENHERLFYAGFSGPLNIEQCTQFYVTLRCAYFNAPRSVRLFAGGGLLAESTVHDEWNEIVAKVQTAYRAVTSDVVM